MAPGGYGYQKLARKERADRDVAHRGLGSKGESGAGLDGEDRRRSTGRSSGTGRSGASQGVWRHGATLGGTAKRFQGSEGTDDRRR